MYWYLPYVRKYLMRQIIDIKQSIRTNQPHCTREPVGVYYLPNFIHWAHGSFVLQNRAGCSDLTHFLKIVTFFVVHKIHLFKTGEDNKDYVIHNHVKLVGLLMVRYSHAWCSCSHGATYHATIYVMELQSEMKIILSGQNFRMHIAYCIGLTWIPGPAKTSKIHKQINKSLYSNIIMMGHPPCYGYGKSFAILYKTVIHRALSSGQSLKVCTTIWQPSNNLYKRERKHIEQDFRKEALGPIWDLGLQVDKFPLGETLKEYHYNKKINHVQEKL